MRDQDGFQDRRTNPDFFDFMMSKYLDPKILKDSTTYQGILQDGKAEGQIEEARRILLRQGTKRFGTPGAKAVAAIEDNRDIDHLERFSLRILDANVRDWNDLLGLA